MFQARVELPRFSGQVNAFGDRVDGIERVRCTGDVDGVFLPLIAQRPAAAGRHRKDHGVARAAVLRLRLLRDRRPGKG